MRFIYQFDIPISGEFGDGTWVNHQVYFRNDNTLPTKGSVINALQKHLLLKHKWNKNPTWVLEEDELYRTIAVLNTLDMASTDAMIEQDVEKTALKVKLTMRDRTITTYMKINKIPLFSFDPPQGNT